MEVLARVIVAFDIYCMHTLCANRYLITAFAGTKQGHVKRVQIDAFYPFSCESINLPITLSTLLYTYILLVQ